MQEPRLYNSRIINTFIEYLQKNRPEVDIKILLAHSGIADYEVEDEGHWLTQKQVDDFSSALMKQTGDPDIFREAGRFMAASRSISTIRQFILGFVTPLQAYTMFDKIAFYVSRGATVETRKISRNKVCIISRPGEGVQEKPYQCENRKGAFEAVAKFFTNMLPVLEHPVCLHQGGDECRYIISWDEPAYLKWKRAGNYLALAAILFITIGALSAFSLPLTATTLFMTSAVIGIFHYSDHLEKKDIYSRIEMQGGAANRLLDQITISYNNALLVQEIGQAVSSILDIDQLLKFVMDTLQRRLDFERGMIMLANQDKTRLVYVSGFGYNPAHEEILQKTYFHLDNPKSKGQLVTAFKEQKPFLISDINDFADDLSDRSYEFAETLGVKSFICVPIVYEGLSLGILAVDNPRSKRQLSQSEVSLLMGIAPQIAISISNANSLRQARESEERFRSLGENSPDIIYTVNTKGIFTYVNPAWEKILGHKRTEVIGKRFIKFVKETDKRSFVEIFSKIKKNKETVNNFEGILLASDGAERLLDMSGAPNINASGEFTGIVGTFKDYTEQRKLEQHLHHASKMEALGTLTGGISHDFNNIVQAISGYNQLLMMKKDETHPDWKHLTGIGNLTQRAINLIKQLLIFSRRVESRLAPIDLNEEIVKFNEIMASTLPKTIAVKLDLADSINIISGDDGQIGQVIMNLAVNARDAMPDGGEIAIHTENIEVKGPYYLGSEQMEPGRYALLSFSDNGVGMDRETLSHIFDPFFTTKEAGLGTGIGLAVVYGIIRNHNGYIHCESEPGKGTTFLIYLPASELKLIEDKRDHETSHELLPGRETILLVDDEPFLIETGQELLNLCGYNVLTAANGEEALAIIAREKEKVDIVVLDLMMPGMGGAKCLSEIKKILPSLKVIVASGYTANIKAENIRKDGAAAFIPKPYRFEELNQIIREVIDTKG